MHREKEEALRKAVRDFINSRDDDSIILDLNTGERREAIYHIPELKIQPYNAIVLRQFPVTGGLIFMSTPRVYVVSNQKELMHEPEGRSPILKELLKITEDELAKCGYVFPCDQAFKDEIAWVPVQYSCRKCEKFFDCLTRGWHVNAK